MPATSQSQQRLFALAEHHPSALFKANKGLANLPEQTLHDFAATPRTGLPKRIKPKRATLGSIMKRKPAVDDAVVG